MQAESKRKWLTPLLIVGGLVLVLVLSNREARTPEEMGLVSTNDEYARALRMAHEITKPIFDKSDAGEEPTEQEKDALFKAAKLIDNANHLFPDKVVPYLGAGKAYMLAGDLELAEVRYRQAIDNAQFDKSDGAKESSYEALYRLSQVRFKQQDYEGAFEAADLAVKAEPNGVEYWVARAAALIQLKRYKEADKDIHTAFVLIPKYRDAVALHKLLEAEDPKTFGGKGKH